MHAVVCLKQIIDPDIPPHLFAIDPVEEKQIRGSQSLVISAFDEIALEVALQLKEKTAGSVTAVTIAGPDGIKALRLALAMGADRAVLLSDPAFEEVSAFGKARILSAALEKLGSFDLVLCGRQAGGRRRARSQPRLLRTRPRTTGRDPGLNHHHRWQADDLSPDGRKNGRPPLRQNGR